MIAFVLAGGCQDCAVGWWGREHSRTPGAAVDKDDEEGRRLGGIAVQVESLQRIIIGV